MIVVSDTDPLNYLALIGHLDALPRLYGKIVVPAAVARELSHPSSPEAVKTLLAIPPTWITMKASPQSDPSLSDLGDGEQEAIVLAETLTADLLLCDDHEAREIARRRNLRVIGTLGVLIEAADEGLLDLKDALNRLRNTNFRLSKKLYETLLRSDGKS